MLSQRGKSLFLQKYADTPNESWEDCVRRFLDTVCDISVPAQKKQDYFDFIHRLEGLPGGRGLANAGITNQLFNCFFLPLDDTLYFDNNNSHPITKILSQFIYLEANDAGVGLNFSKLRGKGSPIHKKGLRLLNPKDFSCGPTGFMDIFHKSAEIITKAGSRKGATMALLEWRHPDIMDFIKIKKDHSLFNHFNISVGVDDTFFKHVKDGHKNETLIWNAIIDGMIHDGEPGLVHLGNAQKYNAIDYIPEAEIRGTNPCGEIPLPDYGSCDLFMINMSKLPKWKPWKKDMMDVFRQRVFMGVELLNLMLRANRYLLDELKHVSEKWRRIGLGVQGLAHYLIQNDIKYGSEECITFLNEFFYYFKIYSYQASVALVDKYGCFDGFYADRYINNPFFDDFPNELKQDIRTKGIANSAINTCAPTSNTSILADTSSGIEPLFQLNYTRKDSLGENVVTDPLYETGQYDKKLFVTADDLSPEQHLEVQKTIQRHIDGSISKTINCLPQKDMHRTLSALLLNNMPYLKGVTVYVKGSRQHEVLTNTTKPLKTPKVMQAIKLDHKINDKKIRIFVTHDNNVPREVFTTTGESEDVGATEDAMCRLISLLLRNNYDIDKIVSQLRKARGSHLNALPHVIAKLLHQFVKAEDHPACPEKNCNGTLFHIEGCDICLVCHYTKCT